ncbi:LysR family transcriptional regulator [Paenibacillus albicereus]|uniref:LysR family transcriptional regulator n=1 Tax=Paenibacillus albicereus TaxID=2726185 RepID=A0A6H2H0Q8_9BACL|nr:LysR family transcriptional regulator [Paenibacillus albicereus]QJC53235.1 LysR family transcriptional regulator [Paenibacillus albicereus]
MQEDLQLFAVIVEQSSMNKASALLNLSQPALSRKIAKLEEELGAPLFRRVGRRLELTRIGELTYDYAVQLRQMHRQYLLTLAEFKQTHRFTLTIGASLTTLQTTLPDLIQALTAGHPQIDIKAVTGKTHEIVSLVRDKKIELGLVASVIDDPQLHCVKLFDDHLELVLPRGRMLSDKLAIEDLNGLPMILFSKGTWFRTLTDELFDKFRLHPDVRMEIDSFEAILRLLHTCGAATLLPRSYIRPQMAEDNDLLIVPLPELKKTRRTTSLIHGDPALLEPVVRQWIAEASAGYAARSGLPLSARGGLPGQA